MNPNLPSILRPDHLLPQHQTSNLSALGEGERSERQDTQYPPQSIQEPSSVSGVNLDPANVQSILSSNEGDDLSQSESTTGETGGETDGENNQGQSLIEVESLIVKLPNISEEREYSALRRSLRRHRGFGIYFVSCVPMQQEQIIQQVQQDLPERLINVLKFKQAVERKTHHGLEKGNFHGVVKDFLQEHGKVDILFIQGLEHSFLDYEETKKQSSGWTSQDIYSYSWKGVPPILSTLR